MSENIAHTDKDTAAFFNEIHNDSLREYTNCSASQAFESVWHCYTLGSQAMHYYRYGEKKDCSMRWEDFKFCLSTKTKSSEVADKMLKKREDEKELQRKEHRSSEDVWNLRMPSTTPIE